MKDLLNYILQNITTQPDQIQIDEAEENDTTHYTISVHPDDVGRVIGREGKIIKAIRSIMRVVAIQKDLRVRVSVKSETEKKETENNNIQEEIIIDQSSEENKDITQPPQDQADPQPPQPPQDQESLTVEVSED